MAMDTELKRLRRATDKSLLNLTSFSGNSLSQPIVACVSKDGSVVEGIVVKAVWTKGANFNRKAAFVVRMNDGQCIMIDGSTVKTTLEG